MKYSTSLLVIYLLLSFSCKKGPQKEDTNSIKRESIITDTPDSPSTIQCFLYTKGKDSIQLKIETHKDSVTGSLSYKFYEKDKSFGVLKGKINGDILKAHYTYEAEGTTSVREVIFMKKDSAYIPGYGETVEKNGTYVFKESASLSFETSQALHRVPCE